MASRRDGIIAAMTSAMGVASVNGFTRPSGLVVSRFRVRPTDKTTLKSISPYPFREVSERVGQNRSPLTQHHVTVRCECRAVCGANETADQALDGLLVWVTQSLFADESLGGLASSIAETACEWDATEADETYAVAWKDVTVTFAALANDPTQRS
jgi:hypothetical protein